MGQIANDKYYPELELQFPKHDIVTQKSCIFLLNC